MTDAPAGPVFVGGLDRTGTSLIYALLASHPSLAMSRRTNWWTYFYGRFGDLGDDRNVDRCLSVMQRYRRHRKLDPDWDRLRADFVAGERSYGRLFALLEAQHAARLHRPRWGDKSLHTERYASLVFEHFPDARIIHMIRDPRDRYASVLKRWKRVRGGAGASTAAWIASIRLGERNREHYPDRYRLLRYEDLAAEPEATMRSICNFIGEPFEPRMMGMEGAADFRDAGGNSSYERFAEGTISTASIGRYRSVLDPADLGFITSSAAAEMRRHGYEVGSEKAPASGRLRYRLVAWPMNAVRMAGWRAREWLYDRLGRAPGSETMSELSPASNTAGDQGT
ncbi:MAG: sulfotransferase [Chloroflexota bacterium]